MWTASLGLDPADDRVRRSHLYRRNAVHTVFDRSRPFDEVFGDAEYAPVVPIGAACRTNK